MDQVDERTRDIVRRADIASIFPCQGATAACVDGNHGQLVDAQALAELLLDVAGEEAKDLPAAHGCLIACSGQRLREMVESQLRVGACADVAHDISQPVTGMGLFVDMWERGAPMDGVVVSHVHRAAHEVYQLITRFTYEYIDTQPVDLNHALFEEKLCSYLPIEIIVTPDIRPAWVSIDRVHFRRVMRNLIKNAYEAGARHVRFSVTGEAERIAVTVWDDGVPISRQVARQLFAERITDKDDGHGYGMQNVQKIITELHGGSIRVHRRRGTKFQLTLPRLSDLPLQIPSPAGGDLSLAHAG